eukprot:gene8369-11324_t
MQELSENIVDTRIGDVNFTKLISESQRINIRKMILSDIQTFYEYRSNPDVARYQSWNNFTIEDSVAFVHNQVSKIPNISGDWIQLSIEMSDTQEHIGDCAFCSLFENNYVVKMGITIGSYHQRKGIGFEAVQTLLSYLFNSLNKEKVIVEIEQNNAASLMLFKKIGFEETNRHPYQDSTGSGVEVEMVLTRLSYQQITFSNVDENG